MPFAVFPCIINVMIVSVAFGSNQSPLFYSVFSVRPSRLVSHFVNPLCICRSSINPVLSKLEVEFDSHDMVSEDVLDPVQKLNCESG